MRAKDVLWILGALADADIRCAVAGGWGIDALVGHKTRKHHDLDLVLLDFERDEPRAGSVLAGLGFQRTFHTHQSTRYMPRRSLFDDHAGRSIDLVDLDEEGLRSVLLRRDRGDDSLAKDVDVVTFVDGRVGGRRVTCLSAPIQSAMLSTFELESHQKRDPERLAPLLARYDASR